MKSTKEVSFSRRSIDFLITPGAGLLILGIAWLLFWLGPAIGLFTEDPRWGHNYALPIIFITVGLGYHIKSQSCQFISVFSSFLTIPILLAFWPWDISTIIAIAFLSAFIIIYFIERIFKTLLVNTKSRLKFWLNIHLLNFSFLGLAHMPLIFFLVRWLNPESFINYLPMEHEISTSTFNALLLILSPIAVGERYAKKDGVSRSRLSWISFVLVILMLAIPLISIGILGE